VTKPFLGFPQNSVKQFAKTVVENAQRDREVNWVSRPWQEELQTLTTEFALAHEHKEALHKLFNIFW